MLLEGRHVVITGASGGIGSALALRCAEQGAHVSLHYHANRSRVEAVALQIEERFGRRSNLLQFDVADLEQVRVAVQRHTSAGLPVDVWVNNAGVNHPGLLLQQDPAAVEHTLAVNLLGSLWCCQVVLPVMLKQRRGVIVNVSSVSATRPTRGQCAYAASKGGVEALTRALAVEYGRKGLVALALRLGPVATEMLASTAALAPELLQERLLGTSPATPETVTRLIVQLLGDEAKLLNGQVITLDGGYSLA